MILFVFVSCFLCVFCCLCFLVFVCCLCSIVVLFLCLSVFSCFVCWYHQGCLLFFVSLFFLCFPVICSCFCLGCQCLFLVFCCLLCVCVLCCIWFLVFVCCRCFLVLFVKIRGVCCFLFLEILVFFMRFVSVSVWGAHCTIRYAWTHHVMLYHAWVAPLAGCLRYQWPYSCQCPWGQRSPIYGWIWQQDWWAIVLAGDTSGLPAVCRNGNCSEGVFFTWRQWYVHPLNGNSNRGGPLWW